MNLMEKLEDFLRDESLINFFKVKGYKPLIKDNWFYLEDLNNHNLERMEIYNDPNNSKRIRFKGTNWAFSLNRDKDNAFYVDHLLIGDVPKEEFIFSMRHQFIDISKEITEENMNIKLAYNNQKHIFHIRKNFIDIERISIKAKSYEDYFNTKATTQYELEHFHFYRNENKDLTLIDSSLEKVKEAIKEFIYLEEFYPTITSYISKDFQIVREAMEKCQEERKNYTKVYTMQRKNQHNN